MGTYASPNGPFISCTDSIGSHQCRREQRSTHADHWSQNCCAAPLIRPRPFAAVARMFVAGVNRDPLPTRNPSPHHRSAMLIPTSSTPDSHDIFTRMPGSSGALSHLRVLIESIAAEVDSNAALPVAQICTITPCS